VDKYSKVKEELNIFITPLYGIGDILMATPAIKVLKENFPKSKITYLAIFSSHKEILKYNPYIDEILFFPLSCGKVKMCKFLLSLRGKYNISINFYPSNRKDYNIAAYIVGADIRIGHYYKFDNLRELNFLKNKVLIEDDNFHNVEENIRLLNFLGIKITEIPKLQYFLQKEEISWAENFLKKRNIINRKLIGIHAGTSRFKNQAKRRWPKEKFAKLIREFLKEEDYFFLLFGTDEEREENYFIKEKVGRNVEIIENLNIRKVAALIKQCNLFITNDSGLMHLAASVNIPIVCIFGPTNPKWVHPWKAKHKIVRLNLPCSPCFYYSPKPLKCRKNGKFPCIRDIEVSQVKKASEEFLKGK